MTTFYGAEIRWAERRFPPGKSFLRWYGRRSHLVAISESTRRMLAPYAARPIDVIPYGVPLPEEAPTAGRGEGPPVLLFVGRLVTRKGVDRLLEAQLLSAPADRRHDLELVKQLVGQHIKRLGLYKCEHCGFRARQYYWRCPGCGKWETYSPRRTETPDGFV